MKLADNIEMLEITNPGPHHPVLMWDDNDVVLIDTSYVEQTEALRAEIERCGFSFDDVTHVILTHQDVDHTGNARILREHGAKIAAGIHEVPFIQGDQPLTKITDMESIDLPPDRVGFFEMLKDHAPKLTVHVDIPLEDGQVLPIYGGLTTVFTPGHTPGHIAVLIPSADLIVCGDAANIRDGVLIGPNPAMTHDMEEGTISFGKLKSAGAHRYVTYHGGYVEL